MRHRCDATGVTMCLMKGAGGRGPCALGAPRRREREAAAHAAPHLSRGLDEGRARLRGLEVGLEEEVEECCRALEVHEEERRRELNVERCPVTNRHKLMEGRQDEVEEQVLAGQVRRAVVSGAGVRRQQDGVERSDAQKRGRAPRGDDILAERQAERLAKWQWSDEFLAKARPDQGNYGQGDVYDDGLTKLERAQIEQGREAYLTGGAKLRYKRLTGQI